MRFEAVNDDGYWRVYDHSRGEYVGKASRKAQTAKRKAAKLNKAGKNPMAKKRTERNCKKRSSKNPKQLLFRTKSAARAYAKAHGVKKFSVRKLKRGR